MSKKLNVIDPKLNKLIVAENKRQQSTINLIASENYAPTAVLEALASSFTNKYSEGYAGKRYYPGNELVDQLETLVIARAKQIFKADHANVQALSGGPANLAIYNALLKTGDTIMALKLTDGGHLSHGHKVNVSGQLYNIVGYTVDPSTGQLNMTQIAKLAKQNKPKLIIAGFSAYSRDIDWAAFGRIAKSVGAYLLADISHTGGLVAGGALANPFPHADVVMTTTHKSLRGPRGAIIMCRQALADQIDRSIFPGFQGGPHMNNIAGIGVALELAKAPAFKKYAKQCIVNAQALSTELTKLGFDIISGGTDTHLIVIDLARQNLSGKMAEEKLAQLGITVSRSTIPADPRSPFDPSGIRLGTPAMTTRGLTVVGAKQLAQFIAAGLKDNSPAKLKALQTTIKAFSQKHRIN